MIVNNTSSLAVRTMGDEQIEALTSGTYGDVIEVRIEGSDRPERSFLLMQDPYLSEPFAAVRSVPGEGAQAADVVLVVAHIEQLEEDRDPILEACRIRGTWPSPHALLVKRDRVIAALGAPARTTV